MIWYDFFVVLDINWVKNYTYVAIFLDEKDFPKLKCINCNQCNEKIKQ